MTASYRGGAGVTVSVVTFETSFPQPCNQPQGDPRSERPVETGLNTQAMATEQIDVTALIPA